MSKLKIDATWEQLFKQGNYRVVWKQNQHSSNRWKVVVVDKSNKPLIMLEVAATGVSVPGGKLDGVMSETLISSESARGKGLPLMLYTGLIKRGQVLFSSNTQTSGSRQLWDKLVRSDIGVPFVLANYEDAGWYIKRFAPHINASNVLLTGSIDELADEAYASGGTRWLIVPKNMASSYTQHAVAINKSTNREV